jgi:hypothetical protein
MAKMSLTDFITELNRRGFDGFDPGDLTRYVNFGYRKIGRLTKWAWEQADLSPVTVQPGSYRLSLQNDISTVKSVIAIVCTTSTFEARLNALTDTEFYDNWAAYDLTSSQIRGEPDSYWLGSTHLYILPPPMAARTYTITAEQKLTELVQNSNEVLVTPDEYDEAVLLAAEEHCHVRARQPQFADVNRKLIQDFFDDALADDTTRSGDLLERVVPGRTGL